MGATNWGIISTGKICNDFVNALNYLPNHEHQIIAVGASSENKAKQFASKHNIPVAYGSYEEVAKNKSIEVVYIGAINSLHYSLCKMVLENGKHLLCEKPLCMNVKDTQELISIAKEKKLFFMEAVWSRCFPLYDELRLMLASNIIGNVMYLKADFGVPISEVPRVKNKELGGGTIFDLGVYVLQLAIFVFGHEPLSVTAAGHLNEDGIDESVNYILKYTQGKMANLCTHSKIKMDNSVVIYGSEGYIQIKDPFWCPTVVFVNNGKETMEKTFPLPSMKCEMNFTNSEGLIYEAMEVRKCLNEGLLQCPKMTHEDSLTIAKLQETVCQLINVKY